MLKTGIEVPVEENIDVIQWFEDPAALSTMLFLWYLAEADYVLFDEDDSRRK